MKFEQASSALGNEVCERLKLDPDCRSVSVVKSPLVTVWDLDSEIERQWGWLATKQADYRLAEDFTLFNTKMEPVPDRVKAIISEEYLEPRKFASHDDEETTVSELAYRTATKRPHWRSRGVRDAEMGKPSRRFRTRKPE